MSAILSSAQILLQILFFRFKYAVPPPSIKPFLMLFKLWSIPKQVYLRLRPILFSGAYSEEKIAALENPKLLKLECPLAFCLLLHLLF